MIWRVATTIIAVPDWILIQAVPGSDSTPDAVFLRSRTTAYYLAKLDRDEGGNPVVEQI